MTDLERITTLTEPDYIAFCMQLVGMPRNWCLLQIKHWEAGLTNYSADINLERRKIQADHLRAELARRTF